MPTAKENFIERISHFESALSSPDLISRALTDVQHNQKAKILRNGMAIIGFTILEDFIKKRIGEIFKKVGTSGIQFNRLPAKLQEASIIDSLKGIQNRAQMLKNNSEDYKLFIQDETSCIASTKHGVYELSAYTLGYDKSNLSENDITAFMKTFNINGGWAAIQNISRAINITLVNPSEIFRNAAQRRHKAAHNAEADSLLSDLNDFISQALVIGFSFDALMSQSLKHINNGNINFLNGTDATEYSDLSFRFIIEDSGIFKEYNNSSTRAYRTGLFDVLFPQTLVRAKTNNQILIVKNRNNKLLNWYNE